jgi:hypothetical protein
MADPALRQWTRRQFNFLIEYADDNRVNMSATIDAMFGVYEKYVRLMNERMKTRRSTKATVKNLKDVTHMCNQWKLLDYRIMSNLIRQSEDGFHQIEDGVFHLNDDRAWPLLPDLHIAGYSRSGDQLTVGFGPRGSPFEVQATYTPKAAVISRGSTTIYKYHQRTEIHSFGERPTVTILKTDPNLADDILSVSQRPME